MRSTEVEMGRLFDQSTRCERFRARPLGLSRGKKDHDYYSYYSYYSYY